MRGTIFLLRRCVIKFIVEPSNLKGEARIPGSKSNTTRAVVIASLAEGRSVIKNPLPSADCLSTVEVYKRYGARVLSLGKEWIIEGSYENPKLPDDVLNTGNSGTTTYIAIGTAGLIEGYTVITGDHQIRRRPSGPLLKAIEDLGGEAISVKGDGSQPVVIKGKIKGGRVYLPGVNSQWLTPLLINTPLADGNTEIYVDNLQERPYIKMTLGWLRRCGIEYEEENMERFFLKGGQKYRNFEYEIPSDWESACFPIVAAAITDSDITLHGLDLNDYQGDKAIISILQAMGADIDTNYGGGIRIRGGKTLHGIEIDCGDTPDAPPILAVLGTQAEGKTILNNLGASRLKETDRARSIAEELRKMGAKIEEYEDSMVIYRSDLVGARINGHTDHRIVMAMTVAGFVAKGNTIVDDAEYVKISFPNFYELMSSLGAKIERVSEV